jgi:hypothetical protein
MIQAVASFAHSTSLRAWAAVVAALISINKASGQGSVNGPLPVAGTYGGLAFNPANLIELLG